MDLFVQRRKVQIIRKYIDPQTGKTKQNTPALVPAKISCICYKKVLGAKPFSLSDYDKLKIRGSIRKTLTIRNMEDLKLSYSDNIGRIVKVLQRNTQNHILQLGNVTLEQTNIKKLKEDISRLQIEISREEEYGANEISDEMYNKVAYLKKTLRSHEDILVSGEKDTFLDNCLDVVKAVHDRIDKSVQQIQSINAFYEQVCMVCDNEMLVKSGTYKETTSITECTEFRDWFHKFQWVDSDARSKLIAKFAFTPQMLSFIEHDLGILL